MNTRIVTFILLSFFCLLSCVENPKSDANQTIDKQEVKDDDLDKKSKNVSKLFLKQKRIKKFYKAGLAAEVSDTLFQYTADSLQLVLSPMPSHVYIAGQPRRTLYDSFEALNEQGLSNAELSELQKNPSDQYNLSVRTALSDEQNQTIRFESIDAFESYVVHSGYQLNKKDSLNERGELGYLFVK